MSTEAIDGPDPRIVQTRRVVVRAAADLLVEYGFGRVTVEAIAERSGVARSTIYRNWGGRAEVLAEAFGLLCSFTDVPDLGSLPDELRVLGDELANGLANDHWGRVLPSLVGAAAHDPEVDNAQRQFSSTRRAMVAKPFERAIARGDISGDHPPGELAEQFAAPFYFRHLMVRQPIDRSFIERQITMIERLTEAG
jgi:AcrR family transcriptional regulator